jgi:hypothetical protein
VPEVILNLTQEQGTQESTLSAHLGGSTPYISHIIPVSFAHRKHIHISGEGVFRMGRKHNAAPQPHVLVHCQAGRRQADSTIDTGSTPTQPRAAETATDQGRWARGEVGKLESTPKFEIATCACGNPCEDGCASHCKPKAYSTMSCRKGTYVQSSTCILSACIR